ncbi:MAG: pyridoxamine 5'-phosphate oxidase [Ignavibacteria bacterium GWA2_35_8]|nr:MAG: pyridoxamine 5'-phosphate oxidase [Ignavibacteria bacterium GWA2_35_8]
MQLFESLSNLRRDYTKGSFSEKTAKENPFEQFKLWFEEVLAAEMLEPTAFVLSTSTKDRKPSSRVLLLKQFDEKGFVFYTNYDSRKGKEIEENPNAAILFFWDKLERQIRIEGKIEKISEVESDKYFQTRPYTSKLGTWASEQSSPLSSRFKLIRQVAQFMAKYPVNVPLPPNWGGYRLIPDVFEFWQGRESRLHDRLQYNKNENGKWVITRLYP